MGYPDNIFLISQRKHVLCVSHRGPFTKCFHGEIKKCISRQCDDFSVDEGDYLFFLISA